MVVLLVIDMQVGLFEGQPPRHDADGITRRIKEVAATVRSVGGTVIFVQHEDAPGGVLSPGSSDWELLPALERTDQDILVGKQACDSFYETKLGEILADLDVKPLIVAGCATDFCVDTTVRAAASRNYEVVVVEDGHTTRGRPHLDAESIIRHHNWMWSNLILPHSQVEVLPAKAIKKRVRSNS